MKVKDISAILEAWAPRPLAESYDNVGLLVGDPNMEVTGALVNLDMTEDVVDEAIVKGMNMVIAHHPIWFTGRKRLNGEDYVSRVIIKAVKNDIALYATHTNLDNVYTGVNAMMARKLGLQNATILRPKGEILQKLTVYVPVENRMQVLEAMWGAGAGRIGNYDQASFSSTGTGSFRPLEGANPHIGGVGAYEEVNEARVEVVFPFWLQGAVVRAMKNAHPYEEVAYEVMATQNEVASLGSGMVGDLPEPLSKADFLKMVKETFRCGGIRYSDCEQETIQRVALCGGSGSFLIPDARRAGADALVTGDITYHKFFDNEGKFLLLDIGHYESEQFTQELIYNFISEKFPNFAIRLSEVDTNPVKYY
ncbi:MAG: Nif3-like dinuclear metal center hexameric protein [Bacteroidia bacterium]|nr:Nif3-like dinuclear metal center hexameric protein [Bacteroidia bacterium]